MRVAIATGQTNRVTEATGLGICLSGFWEQNRKALFFVEKADRKRKIRGSVSWGGKNTPRLSSDDNVKGELYKLRLEQTAGTCDSTKESDVRSFH